MKKLIVQVTTAKITATKRYMHLWQVCLAMTNVQVKIMVTVHNWPIGHMTPEVSDFIPGSLGDTDKYIEVADGHQVKAKQKVQARIKMCDDNGNPFFAT